jgi:hypothetical protein
LVDVFIGFAHNSFEMQHATTCRFSKEFCENPGNVLTNSSVVEPEPQGAGNFGWSRSQNIEVPAPGQLKYF